MAVVGRPARFSWRPFPGWWLRRALLACCSVPGPWTLLLPVWAPRLAWRCRGFQPGAGSGETGTCLGRSRCVPRPPESGSACRARDSRARPWARSLGGTRREEEGPSGRSGQRGCAPSPRGEHSGGGPGSAEGDRAGKGPVQGLSTHGARSRPGKSVEVTSLTEGRRPNAAVPHAGLACLMCFSHVPRPRHSHGARCL